MGVFRNGISSIMGGPGWIGVLLGILRDNIVCGSELGSAHDWAKEVDRRRFRLMCNHLGKEFQFGT